jgi:hypothetical protein
MHKTLRSMVCGLVIVVGVAGARPAEAVPVTLGSSVVSIAPNGAVDIRFDIGDLTAAAFSGFDIDVLFDATLFAFTSASFSDPVLGSNQLDLPEATALPFAGGAFDLGGGRLDVFGLSGNSTAVLEALQASAFRFLTLSFTSLGAIGTGTFAIDLLDPNLLFLDAAAGDLAITGTLATSVTVAAPSSVPEPTSLMLLFVGMGALAVRSRFGARGL